MKTRIKELRAARGMTQADLAKEVGVRRETIVFLEKGKYNPSLQLAHNIAVTFDQAIEEDLAPLEQLVGQAVTLMPQSVFVEIRSESKSLQSSSVSPSWFLKSEGDRTTFRHFESPSIAIVWR